MSDLGELKRCENCGETAGPGFCPHCGQEVDTRRGPLLEIAHSALSDWWSLDSRLLRSMRALLRPGRLSQQYLRGRRAPFLRPFRLYMIASLALFSTLLTLESQTAGGLDIYIGGELIGTQNTGNVRGSIQLLDARSLLGRWMIGIYGDRLERLRQRPRQEIVDMLFSGLRRVLPLTLILFVPFLALALKLLHIRGRTEHSLYFDHLVFSLHYQSALFLALSGAWLVTRLPGVGIVGSVLVYGLTAFGMLVVYLPWGLRRFYSQSRLWTSLKALVLLFIYLRVLTVIVGLSTVVAIWRA